MVLYTFFRKLGVAKDLRVQGHSRPWDGRDPSCSCENIGQVKRPRCFVMQPGLDRAVLKQKRLRKFVDVCTYQIYMVAICICMYLYDFSIQYVFIDIPYVCVYMLIYIYTQTHEFWFSLLLHDRCDSMYIYIYTLLYFTPYGSRIIL